MQDNSVIRNTYLEILENFLQPNHDGVRESGKHLKRYSDAIQGVATRLLLM